MNLFKNICSVKSFFRSCICLVLKNTFPDNVNKPIQLSLGYSYLLSPVPAARLSAFIMVRMIVKALRRPVRMFLSRANRPKTPQFF